MEAVYLAFVLVLSIFLGFELISKVPATLHTPLMSGANAISAWCVLGSKRRVTIVIHTVQSNPEDGNHVDRHVHEGRGRRR